MAEIVANHEQRLVALEEIKGTADRVLKWVKRWGWILLAAIASSNLLGDRADKLLDAFIAAASG